MSHTIGRFTTPDHPITLDVTSFASPYQMVAHKNIFLLSARRIIRDGVLEIGVQMHSGVNIKDPKALKSMLIAVNTNRMKKKSCKESEKSRSRLRYTKNSGQGAYKKILCLQKP